MRPRPTLPRLEPPSWSVRVAKSKYWSRASPDGRLGRYSPGARGPVDIVDAAVDDGEREQDNSVQQLDRVAAGDRHPPQRARPVRGLEIVEVGAIGRGLHRVPNGVRHPDRFPAG